MSNVCPRACWSELGTVLHDMPSQVPGTYLFLTWVKLVWEPCPFPAWEQCTPQTWPIKTFDFRRESYVVFFYTKGHFKTLIMETPDSAR